MSRTTSISPRLLACALTGAAALAAAPGASASAPIKAAQFDVTVKGTQASIWDYTKVPVPPCTTGNQDFGDQTIRFRTRKPVHVLVAGGGPLGNLVFSPIPLAATAVRNASLTRTGEVDPKKCPASGSGGEDAPPLPKSDCGTRKGTLAMDLYYDPERPSNELGMIGYAPEFGPGSEDLNSAYTNCPFSTGNSVGSEAGGGLLSAKAKVPQRKLFNRRTKQIVFHVATVAPATSGEGSEKTITTYNITMKRRAAAKG